MALLSITKRTIAAKKIETISMNPSIVLSIWVEKGSVEVLAALNGKPIGKIDSAGAVALTGVVHLRAGKESATVFVAMAEGDAPTFKSTPKKMELPPPSFDASGPELSNVLCNVHGLVTKKPTTEAGCEAAQERHIEDFPDCADETVIRPA